MPPFRHLLSRSSSVKTFQRCALVLGHPGHELKVFGWTSEHRPRVYLITDGSGHQGTPRTLSTAALITQLGSDPGEVFGCVSDVEIYRAMLEGDCALFLRLVDQLADSFLKHEIDMVAGDAAEGFNPTHDICRALIDAAVLKVQRATGKTIDNLEFSLTEWEQNSPQPQHDDHCLHFILDDDLLAAKLSAAQTYVELKNEVRAAIAQRGEEYFRVECLRKVIEPAPHVGRTEPAYETWGRQRVREGKYQTVIRFREHILPIMNAVLNYAVHAAPEPSLVVSKR